MDTWVRSGHAWKEIKLKTRELIKQAGGQDSAATITRVNTAMLGHYGNLNRPDSFITADVIADLEKDARSPTLTRVLARFAGYELMQMSSPQNDPVWARLIAKMAKEASDVFHKVGEALSDDGEISKREINDLSIIREIDELIEVALESRRRIHERLES